VAPRAEAGVIRRLVARGYKSLRGADIALPAPLAVVMGPNASGKTNFFDALALLARLGVQPSLEQAFGAHRGRVVEAFAFGPGGVAEALTRDSLAFQLVADVELSDAVVRETEEEIDRQRSGFAEAKPERAPRVVERLLRYALTVEYRPRERRLAVSDESLVALGRGGELKESRAPFLSRVGEQAFGLRLEGQPARPAAFDAGEPGTVLSRPVYAPHYPHVEALRRELAGWRFYQLETSRLRADNDLEAARSPGRSGQRLAAFFDTLEARHPERLRAAADALRRLLPSISGLSVDRTGDGFLRLVVHDEGAPVPARLLSEGTLRLLGLVAALHAADGPTVVALEEPEASVHPRRIGELARLLEGSARAGGFQVLVNTHSPLLASSVPEGALVVCRRGSDGTTMRPFAGAGPLFKPVEIERALSPLDDHE
jgi:predicted ATPase